MNKKEKKTRISGNELLESVLSTQRLHTNRLEGRPQVSIRQTIVKKSRLLCRLTKQL